MWANGPRGGEARGGEATDKSKDVIEVTNTEIDEGDRLDALTKPSDKAQIPRHLRGRPQ